MSKLEMLRKEEASDAFRLTDFPMHYFAAIQSKNQDNLDGKLAACGLSPMEWRILATLHQRAPCTVSDISDITTVDRFRVGRGLKTLMDKGFVANKEDRSDRRRRRIVLTTDGKQAYQNAFTIMREVYLSNFEGVTDEEYDQLMRLLRRIKDNVFRSESY